ncbi:FtsW/RodA/SpoVE family cell cycle protein [Stomatobaculum longum]|jgi:bacterial cell division membrane protein|uniref:FtsW/RodA/SpoVE family cell cycle protein n=1 Tax=Stomatobaculum longum TaxID=796942 RepID=UPI0028ED80B7|nr:FtsW/RodA/SpoVE family cell cycle protein [Stomatobaculum longum]
MDVKHFLRAFSFRLFFAVCALNVIGILAINSATNQSMAYVGRQATGMALGIAIIALICFVPYQKLLRYAVLVFAICAILLLMVRFFGRSVNGAKRWVVLPAIGQVQPSEFAKIGVVMFFAWLLGKNRESVNEPRFLLIFGAFAMIPIGLISSEPDLSTTIVVTVSILAMLFAAELSYRWIGLGMLVAVPFGVSSVFLLQRGMVPFLKDYQVRRILAFLYPAKYADANWQQDNSIMAIGSGQLFGKGLNNNTLASVKSGNFLSEEQTDFIFAVIGEEMGFVGCLLVLLLYAILVYECFYLAGKARDMEGRIICTGVGALIAFQGFSNIAVATGIFPNTGLTLPFISYGVSSLLAFYVQIGLVINVGLQRRDIVHEDDMPRGRVGFGGRYR